MSKKIPYKSMSLKHEKSVLWKTLRSRKSLWVQFQICIKNLPSDQRADSQVNLSKLLENIGTILLKLAQILPKTAPENFHRGCLSKIQREWKCDLRYVENHVKNLWRSFFIFVKIANIFTEKLHHRCLTVSWIHLRLLCVVRCLIC